MRVCSERRALRKIAVINQKGGVGKTTTVANVAAALAAKGLRVAAADLDPQAHLTVHFGVDPKSVEHGSYAVLTKSTPFDEAVVCVRENLYLLGANIDLVGAESELVSVLGRETILREAINHSSKNFDYVLLDCPPSLGLLTLNALAAAEEVFIPIQPHFLALQGFGQLLQTILLVNQRINPELKVDGILFCLFDSRTSLSAEVKNDIRRFLDSSSDGDSPWSNARIIPVHVRRNIKLAEAPSYGKTIFEYDSNCHGAQDYAGVAEYIHSGKLVEPRGAQAGGQDESGAASSEPDEGTTVGPQEAIQSAGSDVSEPASPAESTEQQSEYAAAQERRVDDIQEGPGGDNERHTSQNPADGPGDLS